ncbi:Myosin-2 essential light chain [Trichinella spiralis]|uniref:Myosin-2 essential light chain n=1 Tax=Trichinella spiralis TaxID=6334 RepID=A0ABR3K2U4_TRISP
MEDSLNEAREVFAYFDTKGDERISVTQVGDVLRSLGQNPTNEEIKKCCANWPTPDFLPILHTVMKNKEPQSGDKFIEGLSHFDKEGNGFISVAELRHLLTHLGERLTDEEVDQLLQGQEDSDEFCIALIWFRGIISD